MDTNSTSTVSNPHPHSQSNSERLKLCEISPISNSPNADSLSIMPESESPWELKMSDMAKTILGTVMAGIILGSLGWVNFNINNLTLSVNSAQTTMDMQWKNIEKKFEAIDSQMWAKSDAASAEKMMELRFKIFEDRLSTLEQERSEYIRLLRNLNEGANGLVQNTRVRPRGPEGEPLPPRNTN